jgi:hypothetical protein
VKVQLVKNSAGEVVAAAEVYQSTLGLSSAEPLLGDGQQVEVVEVPSHEFADVQSFFASRGGADR